MVSEAAEVHAASIGAEPQAAGCGDTDADGLLGIEFAPYDRCSSIVTAGRH